MCFLSVLVVLLDLLWISIRYADIKNYLSL